jgi:hypothetical protein
VDLDDPAFDVRCPREDPWLNEVATRWKLENCKLDQAKGEVKACILLQEISHLLDTFPYTVSDNEQQESTAPQIPLDPVVKSDFIGIWVV